MFVFFFLISLSVFGTIFDMDVYRKIECVELLIALAYYLYSERKARHSTRIAFLSMACALFVDIVFLHGRKPLWAWYLLNVPFLWYIYEKTLRKFVLTFVRNMAAIFVVMFPE